MRRGDEDILEHKTSNETYIRLWIWTLGIFLLALGPKYGYAKSGDRGWNIQ